MRTVLGEINAVLFDKDGTLLDFHATWDLPLGSALRASTGGNTEALTQAAAAVGFDLVNNTILPGAPFVAESNQELGQRLRPFLDLVKFNSALTRFARRAPLQAAGVDDLLDWLVAESVSLAVVTNDSEAQARQQVEQLGWTDYLKTVVGFDSGYGAKPDSGPVLGAIEQIKADPGTTLMVGDTMHDLEAGHAADTCTGYIGSDPELIAVADIAGPSITELFASLPGDSPR